MAPGALEPDTTTFADPLAPVAAADEAMAARASASARTVLVARAAGLMVTFIGAVVLARALGPDGRGAHGFLVALTVILVSVTGLGLPVGAYALRSRDAATDRLLAANAPWFALVAAAVAVAGVVLLESTLRILPPALGAVPGWPLAVFLVVAGFALNGHQLQISLGSGRALLGAFLSFGTYAIAALGYVVVFIAGGTLEAAVWVLAASPYVATAATRLARPRSAALAVGLPDGAIARATLREGLRFFPGELAAMLHQRLDVVLLGVISPAATTGVYVVAYQTAEPILVIASAAQAAILALGNRDASEDRSGAVARLVRETLVLGGGLCLVAAVLAPLAIPVLYGASFGAAITPFLILLPAVLVLAAGRVAAAELTRRNRLEATVAASVVALTVNLALNLALIPAFGAVGAAVASLCSYAVHAALALVLLRRAGGPPFRAMVPGLRDVLLITRRARNGRSPATHG